MNVQRFTEFDYEIIGFKQPVKTPDQRYRSATTSPILVQTPSMTLASATTEGKATLELQVTNDDFYQFNKRIDTFVVQHAYKNRDIWFKDVEVNMAMVEDAYKSPLFRGADGKPHVRYRMNVENDKVHTTVFEGRELLTADVLQPGRDVDCIVELKGLTLCKDSICPDWIVHAVKVVPLKTTPPCLFVDDGI